MSYTALILDEDSKTRLFNHLNEVIPDGWEKICHHMTINLGLAENGPAADLIGQEFEVIATDLAIDHRVIAVRVESEVPSNNHIKHITVAVNTQGGKAKHSNELSNWKTLDQPIVMRGVVQVVY